MAENNGKTWPLPAYEFFEDPVHGKGVRFNFALNHPDEEMARHRGRFVAWSFDGTTVLASAATGRELMSEVHRLNLASDDYVIARIPDDA